MARLYLSESRWRMVRRVLKKKRFQFADARNQTRHDQTHFDWLVEEGFFVEAADGWFELTDKGKHSADLGEYEWEPTRSAPDKKPTRGRK